MADRSKIGTFPLRLPLSTRQQAVKAAERDGISLNQFVNLAVAEKISRMETANASQKGFNQEDARPLNHTLNGAYSAS